LDVAVNEIPLRLAILTAAAILKQHYVINLQRSIEQVEKDMAEN
jgi:hypothetical protein